MNGGTCVFLPARCYLPGAGSPLPPVATPCPTPSLLITFSLRAGLRSVPSPSRWLITLGLQAFTGLLLVSPNPTAPTPLSGPWHLPDSPSHP